jgi:hypothetical protein
VTDLARALIDSLEPRDLAILADRLAPFLPAPPATSEWLGTRQAAAHLGISVHALHRLTGSRAIPFHQDRPGARCWFLRSELDEWRMR